LLARLIIGAKNQVFPKAVSREMGLPHGKLAGQPTLVGPNRYRPDVTRDITQQAANYARSSRTPATIRAYRSDWRISRLGAYRWGNANLPRHRNSRLYWRGPRSNAEGLDLAARQRCGCRHRLAGLTSTPDIRRSRRFLAVSDAARQPAEPEECNHRRRTAGDDPQAAGDAAVRDRAILLIGFAGAFRRSD